MRERRGSRKSGAKTEEAREARDRAEIARELTDVGVNAITLHLCSKLS